MENLELWDALKQPPPEALKTIRGGRLSGMTDISPQWRYKALTEHFGPCGIGWKFNIVDVWNEPGPDGQVFAFAKIEFFISSGDNRWSDPIPGIGGSMLVAKEKAGLHASDEGYKMAVTDALSTATKMIGVAADIYAGLWDGSKYKDSPVQKKGVKEKSESVQRRAPGLGVATKAQYGKLYALGFQMWPDEAENEVKYRVRGIGAWFRKGEVLTKKEASNLIEDWDAAVEQYMEQKGNTPDDYGSAYPDAEPPAIEDDPHNPFD